MKTIYDLLIKLENYLFTLDSIVSFYRSTMNTVNAENSLKMAKMWTITLAHNDGSVKPEYVYTSTLSINDKFRHLIDSLDEFIKNSMSILGTPDIPQFKAEMILKYLTEAKFWLEYELDELKDE